MEIIIIYVLLASGVGMYARSKNHSGIGMFLLSLLITPLIGLIIELLRYPYPPPAD